MSKEEKLMILQMVSEGKITPEQGAELLRAVGESQPAAPAPAPAPAPSPAPASRGQTPDEIAARIQEKIERATRKASAHAEDWANKLARHADDIARRASSEGENIGKVLGESGANLGKVLGESGENLGKIISRIFGGSFSDENRYEFHEEVRGELPAEGELSIALSTLNGRITVDTWDEKGFKLDVRKTSNAASEAEAKEITKDGYEFKQDGLNITAQTREPGGPLSLVHQYTIGFTLTIPRDRKAALNLASSNGGISVVEVVGSRLHATTSNGRIEVEGSSFAETELGSANGRIEYEGRPGNFNASTANGRISAKLAGAGNWKLTSAHGRIEVEVRREPGTAYSVEAATVMGKIEVDGMENAEVLVDETKQSRGSRRFHARDREFDGAASKAALYASTTMGKVTVTF